MDRRPNRRTAIDRDSRQRRGIGELTSRKAISGNRCMLSLKGELKHGNADDLYQEVIQLFESGATELVLDFRELTYCDTTGLQSLVRIYKYVQEYSNFSFTILVHEDELNNILRTCRFDKFMKITHDESIAAGDWRQV